MTPAKSHSILPISSRWTLILVSTGVVLLLVVLLAGISLNYMETAQDKIDIITEKHNKKIDLLNDMTSIVSDRSFHLHSMYFNKDLWRRSEEFEKFNELAPEFIKLKKQFLAMDLTGREKEKFDQAIDIINHTQPLQITIRDNLLGDRDNEARKILADEDISLEHKLLEIFKDLTKDLREASKREKIQISEDFQFATILFIAITLLIILVVCIGAFYVGRRIAISESRLFEEKERAEVTLNTIANGVITTDINCKILTMNPAAANLIQWDQDSVIGRKLEDVYCVYELGENREIDRREFWAQIEGPCMHTAHHHRLIGRFGNEIVIEETVSPICDKDQNTIQFNYTFRDVTYDRDRSDLALRDSLTGAMNRRYLEKEMQGLIYSAHDTGHTHGFLYIDIDFFKKINDTHGHTAGDKVLHGLTTLMLGQIRKEDVLVRLGGDEFAVLVKNCDLNTTAIIANKILDSINNYTLAVNDEKLVEFGASIGVTMIRPDTIDSAQVMDEADRACYKVKKAGRNGMCISHVIEDYMNQLEGY